MTPQEFSFSGKLSKDIVRSKIWGRKRRKLTRAVFFLIFLNLTYHPRYPDRVTMLSEPSPKHHQYQFFDVVQSLSLVWLLVTPCTARTLGSPALLMSQSLLKLMTFQWVMLCSHLALCCSLLLLPPIISSINFFPVILHLASGGQYVGSSCSASVLMRRLRDCFLHALLVWTPWSPQNSYLSSPVWLLQYINVLALSSCGPAPFSVGYSWKSALIVWIFFCNPSASLCGV